MDGLFVGATQRDDQVGMAFGRLDELFVHGFQHLAVTVNNHLGCASTFYDVTLNDSDKTFVGVGIDKDFQVHQIAKLFLPKCHNTLDYNYFAWFDKTKFAFIISSKIKVIYSAFYLFYILQKKIIIYQRIFYAH